MHYQHNKGFFSHMGFGQQCVTLLLQCNGHLKFSLVTNEFSNISPLLLFELYQFKIYEKFLNLQPNIRPNYFCYIFQERIYHKFINFYQKNLNLFQMLQQEDYLFDLFEKLSKRLNKPLDEMKQFYHILKDNWYDNEQALKQLTDQQYNEMKIPGRLVNAIKEELGIKINTPQTKQPPKQGQSEIKTQSSNNKPQVTMNEFTMVQFVNQLQHYLKTQYKNNISQVGDIFQTLYKIIHNIISDPYEIKYRTLKKSNNMVQRIIVSNPSVVKFLALFGFEQDNEKYYIDAPKTHQLIFIEEVILQKAQLMKKQNFQPFLGSIKMPPKQNQQNLMTNKQQNKVFGSFDQQFSKQKISEMKYVDALEKLLEFRHKIMSKPPSERKLRIYHKRFETKSTMGLKQVNMQEEFQKSEDKMIQSYWSQIMSQNRKNSTFQSKRKQEFDFLVKQKIHKETIIKVKLPNEFIIEARFGPLQKLKDVMKLVSEIIIGDLYLFLTPPVKRLDKEMEKTLFELDSVPMGSFYLGVNGDWYIQNEFSKIIQK